MQGLPRSLVTRYSFVAGFGTLGQILLSNSEATLLLSLMGTDFVPRKSHPPCVTEESHLYADGMKAERRSFQAERFTSWKSKLPIKNELATKQKFLFFLLKN